jgi:hypothetical protein
MDAGRGWPHIIHMNMNGTSETKALSARFLLPLVALIAFSVYSAAIVVNHGYVGFLQLAWREPWAMQMLLDLTIGMVLFLVWAAGDSRARGLPFWPFALVTLFLGSVGPLAYLVVRAVRAPAAA